MKTKVLYSTDVDLLQSSLIVTDANIDTYNNCIYLEYDFDNNTYQVYTFDLIDDLNDWFNLEDLINFAGFDYKAVPENKRTLTYWAHLTGDFCMYYGAGNLDNYPQTMTKKELETYLTERL